MRHFLLPIIALFICACDSHTTRRDGPSLPPDIGNQRPPAGEDQSYNPELADKVWRLTGLGADMRYDRGGVLFLTDRRPGHITIVDLDGVTRAEFSHSGLRPDSTYAAPELIFRGSPVPLLEARMMAKDHHSLWLRLLTANSTSLTLVIPPQ